MGPSDNNDVTIISIFGTIAAFYSSMVFIYVFLFGVDLRWSYDSIGPVRSLTGLWNI
ncbi:hypothetical protein C1645_838881 [Glomus cerebriforme]|uniref:Uncharacterized protein n=1 Tax=Glomus cerebriforme TaxID=658196 RepID=A0A397SD72_9GLOM|nr:hypothetical protein C1645_838881 [Glomus cerebriforme]